MCIPIWRQLCFISTCTVGFGFIVQLGFGFTLNEPFCAFCRGAFCTAADPESCHKDCRGGSKASQILFLWLELVSGPTANSSCAL